MGSVKQVGYRLFPRISYLGGGGGDKQYTMDSESATINSNFALGTSPSI